MLIKDGKVHYARIGIKLAPLTPALARQLGLDDGTKGVLVGDVVPGSPADKAGLKQGDVITSFAGEKVNDRSSFRLKVATSEVAKSYEIVYLRDGKQRTTSIVAGPGREGRLRCRARGRVQGPCREGRAREDRDQRLRPGSPAADRRAGQAARTARRPQGRRRLLRQGGQPRRRGRASRKATSSPRSFATTRSSR